MFRQFTEFLLTAINNKLKSNNRQTPNSQKTLSSTELSQGQYANLWSLLPGKPIQGDFVVLNFQGLSQISNSLNVNPMVNGQYRQIEPIEQSLLYNLNATAPTEPCNSLYIFYQDTLVIDPMAPVWAVAQQGDVNKVFVRMKDSNGILVFMRQNPS